jgi:hypothetical protein
VFPSSADDAEGDHHPRGRLGGFEQAADALDQDEAADREQDRGVRRRQRLGPAISPGGGLGGADPGL